MGGSWVKNNFIIPSAGCRDSTGGAGSLWPPGDTP